MPKRETVPAQMVFEMLTNDASLGLTDEPVMIEREHFAHAFHVDGDGALLRPASTDDARACAIRHDAHAVLVCDLDHTLHFVDRFRRNDAERLFNGDVLTIGQQRSGPLIGRDVATIDRARGHTLRGSSGGEIAYEAFVSQNYVHLQRCSTPTISYERGFYMSLQNRTSRYALLVLSGIAMGFLAGAASRSSMRADAAPTAKPVKWKHKCERPFNFDELAKTIEAREEQGWEMFTVAPVVMSAPVQGDTNAYLRYVACFKKISTDD